jgi:SAM-dependent methyltransferase
LANAVTSHLLGFRRKLRWLLGRGWSAEDFAARYAAPAADVWGYRQSPQHRQRAEAILAALPQPRFAHALEVGCAQGFLSEQLAPRVDRLVACDFSAEAIKQAQENARGLANVEFRVADIRDGFPGEGFDLCLFSDVLYYLAPREIDAVLAEAAEKTREGGCLLIANEWRASAQGLTPPTHAFARLDASPLWARESGTKLGLGEGEMSIACYRRLL